MDRRKCTGFLQVCIEVDFNAQYPWCWFDKQEVDELKALQFEFRQMVDHVDEETWQSICNHWGRPFLEVLNEAATIRSSAHMFPLGPPPLYPEVMALPNERRNFGPNVQSQNEAIIAQNQLAFMGMPDDGVQHQDVDIQQHNVDIQHPNVDYQLPFIDNHHHNVEMQNPNINIQQPNSSVHPNIAIHQADIAIQEPDFAFQQPNFGIPHPAMNAVQNMNLTINNIYPQPNPPAPVPMANNNPQHQFIVQPLAAPQPVMPPSLDAPVLAIDPPGALPRPVSPCTVCHLRPI